MKFNYFSGPTVPVLIIYSLNLRKQDFISSVVLLLDIRTGKQDLNSEEEHHFCSSEFSWNLNHGKEGHKWVRRLCAGAGESLLIMWHLRLGHIRSDCEQKCVFVSHTGTAGSYEWFGRCHGNCIQFCLALQRRSMKINVLHSLFRLDELQCVHQPTQSLWVFMTVFGRILTSELRRERDEISVRSGAH